jgi:hypothetical protein
LTKDKFERNYDLFKNGLKWRTGKPNRHCTEWEVAPEPRFAKYYLGLFETGRRPLEVSQYGWEMISSLEVDGRTVRFFNVPPQIVKKDQFNVVIISDRLWNEISHETDRTGLVFTNKNGTQWKNWDKHKAKLEKIFGADCGWIRDCRRGFVTHKAEVEKKDPRHIKDQAGLKTNSIFDRYRIGKLQNQIDLFRSESSNTNDIQNDENDRKSA